MRLIQQSFSSTEEDNGQSDWTRVYEDFAMTSNDVNVSGYGLDGYQTVTNFKHDFDDNGRYNRWAQNNQVKDINGTAILRNCFRRILLHRVWHLDSPARSLCIGLLFVRRTFWFAYNVHECTF